MKKIIVIFTAVCALFGMGLAWGDGSQTATETRSVYVYSGNRNSIGWESVTLTLSSTNSFSGTTADPSLLPVTTEIKEALSSAGYTSWIEYKGSNNNALWATNASDFANAYQSNATLQKTISDHGWNSMLDGNQTAHSTAQSVMNRIIQ